MSFLGFSYKFYMIWEHSELKNKRQGNLRVFMLMWDEVWTVTEKHGWRTEQSMARLLAHFLLLVPKSSAIRSFFPKAKGKHLSREGITVTFLRLLSSRISRCHGLGKSSYLHFCFRFGHTSRDIQRFTASIFEEGSQVSFSWRAFCTCEY